ncbi:MAG: hypothetical protein JWO88_1252 [Frankiales bacterium]|nr:hypothetical protein [Frankiales bacterium]
MSAADIPTGPPALSACPVIITTAVRICSPSKVTRSAVVSLTGASSIRSRVRRRCSTDRSIERRLMGLEYGQPLTRRARHVRPTSPHRRERQLPTGWTVATFRLCSRRWLRCSSSVRCLLPWFWALASHQGSASTWKASRWSSALRARTRCTPYVGLCVCLWVSLQGLRPHRARPSRRRGCVCWAPAYLASSALVLMAQEVLATSGLFAAPSRFSS